MLLYICSILQMGGGRLCPTQKSVENLERKNLWSKRQCSIILSSEDRHKAVKRHLKKAVQLW